MLKELAEKVQLSISVRFIFYCLGSPQLNIGIGDTQQRTHAQQLRIETLMTQAKHDMAVRRRLNNEIQVALYLSFSLSLVSSRMRFGVFAFSPNKC
jgi:hypothetical protein